MNTYKLILKRRTIRKFSNKKIKQADLVDCINAARLAPSSANLQPLEYILVTKNLNLVFECTHWAGYLKDGAPKHNEHPNAYIFILSNTEISKQAKFDVGLAAQNIILTALERGIASCILGNLEREKLSKILSIPEKYFIELAVVLGYPKQISIEDKFKGDVKYWLDEKQVLHVPKKSLKDIIHKETY
ncbi:MAG: nitroreductase family protein [Candidatus Daviesbacteria bacterium]|nr:nitroreductase family protein [Candidatus Daviesbacteria bacterium]